MLTYLVIRHSAQPHTTGYKSELLVQGICIGLETCMFDMLHKRITGNQIILLKEINPIIAPALQGVHSEINTVGGEWQHR